jgi:hypothetical protein
MSSKKPKLKESPHKSMDGFPVFNPTPAFLKQVKENKFPRVSAIWNSFEYTAPKKK